MPEIIPFELESGETIYIESRASQPSGPQPAGFGQGATAAVEKVSESFESALDRIKPAARAVVKAFQEVNEPDEIQLEFGLNFSSEVKAFVMTGEAEASFKLSLTWKNGSKSSSTDSEA